MKRRNFLRDAFFALSGLSAGSHLIGCNSRQDEVLNESGFQLKRSIPATDEYDVVVVGGGMAGSVAAIAAARQGARTLIVENIGSLGGMGTNGLVCAWDGMADGEKNIIGGIMLELTETMFDSGGMSEWDNGDSFRKNFLHPTRIKPEVLRRILDHKVLESGAEIRFFSRLIDVESDKQDKRVKGIVVSQTDGMYYIPGKTFIDATGDAVLSHLAGAECWEAGRDSEHIMPPTLCGMYTGTRWTDEKVNTKKMLEKAISDGVFSKEEEAKFYHFIVSTHSESLRTLNGGRIYGTNPLDNASYTNAMIEGRKVGEEFARFMRGYLPGHENAELAYSASLLGVRESRRIIGEYTLTFNDFKARRQFPDQIGVYNKEVDIHPHEPTEEAQRKSDDFSEKVGRLKAGEVYGLPYGMIVPRGWKNLWAAGRCASGDEVVSGSYRVMPSAAMLGQAAGMAAVQSINNGEYANNLNTKTLVQSLKGLNAYLPQDDLNNKMTKQ